MIKLFVSDIDGTLTDGGVYYSEHGEELVRFNRKDGLGFEYLQQQKIQTMLISGEENGCNRRRAEKMNVNFVLLGVKDKKEKLEEFLFKQRIDWKDVAYIGDDVNDLDCLRKAGLTACPNDAAYSIQLVPGIYICQCDGGRGAVREFAEMILEKMTRKERAGGGNVGLGRKL